MRLASKAAAKAACTISIHASLRDATSFVQYGRIEDSTISIHASLRDATPWPAYRFPMLLISIHASLRDATFLHWQTEMEPTISIHASLRDATVFILTQFAKKEFQSTHPCGMRPA